MGMWPFWDSDGDQRRNPTGLRFLNVSGILNIYGVLSDYSSGAVTKMAAAASILSQ